MWAGGSIIGSGAGPRAIMKMQIGTYRKCIDKREFCVDFGRLVGKLGSRAPDVDSGD